MFIASTGLLRPYTKSIMVEGGASVIASFLATVGSDSKVPSVVDQLVLTIAPVIVGGLLPYEGIGKAYARRLEEVAYTIVGKDIMVIGHFKDKST